MTKNILTHPKEWAREHYDQGLGDMDNLQSFAKRYNLAHNLNRACEKDHVHHSVRDALNYLLRMTSDI